MAHTRICRFNTRDMWTGQDPDSDLAMAVRAGNRVLLRALEAGINLEGNLVGVGDAGAQAEQAMQNVKQLLEEAGRAQAKPCLQGHDLHHEPGVSPRCLSGGWKMVEGVHPCSTGLIVAGLAALELVMEIDVEAEIPDADTCGETDRPTRSQ